MTNREMKELEREMDRLEAMARGYMGPPSFAGLVLYHGTEACKFVLHWMCAGGAIYVGADLARMVLS